MDTQDHTALRSFTNLDSEALPFAHNSKDSYITFLKARQKLNIEGRTLLADLENDMTISGTNVNHNTNINMVNRNNNLNSSTLSTYTDTESFISEVNIINESTISHISNISNEEVDDDDDGEIPTIPSVRTITSSITDYPKPIKTDNWIGKENNNEDENDQEEAESFYIPTFHRIENLQN